MSHVELTSRVGADGVLRISVPFGPHEANREVKVTVEPTGVRAPLSRPSREEWQQFIHATAGCISDPTFQRPPQGIYEPRSEAFP
jgi:hypothetical protein